MWVAWEVFGVTTGVGVDVSNFFGAGVLKRGARSQSLKNKLNRQSFARGWANPRAKVSAMTPPPHEIPSGAYVTSSWGRCTTPPWTTPSKLQPMLSCFRYFSEKHLLLSNSRQRILHEGMNGLVDAKELLDDSLGRVWFQLSLSRSAPCGTGQTTIDTGCDPTLARNLVDHPADCNPFTKSKSIKFPFIWPSTLIQWWKITTVSRGARRDNRVYSFFSSSQRFNLHKIAQC